MNLFYEIKDEYAIRIAITTVYKYSHRSFSMAYFAIWDCCTGANLKLLAILSAYTLIPLMPLISSSSEHTIKIGSLATGCCTHTNFQGM